MRFHELIAEAPETPPQGALDGVDLTSWETFKASLRRLPRAQMGRLQAWMDAVRTATQRPHPGYVELYHGAPNAAAEDILRGGFRHVSGQRSRGFLGATYRVDNLGVFLTDSPAMARYFGANRADHAGDTRVLTCFVDATAILDGMAMPAPLRRLGVNLLNAHYGSRISRIPMRDFWWLLDQPRFVAALTKAGYSGLRFPESPAIRRIAGPGQTWFVCDPAAIRVAGRDGVATVHDFYRWLAERYGADR